MNTNDELKAAILCLAEMPKRAIASALVSARTQYEIASRELSRCRENADAQDRELNAAFAAISSVIVPKTAQSIVSICADAADEIRQLRKFQQEHSPEIPF